ncbi:MAG TPA: endonuclease domain-containing protein [Burkholderiales bacterium]|nr:endonuclease domain-containing protein [Burkholderiales bacterium]
MPGYIRYRRELKPRARELRRECTGPERKLWYEYLRGSPHKFTRQKPLGRYIADFYCAEKRLVIELDGDSHFDRQGMQRDALRTSDLEASGVRIIRFTNLEVMQEFEGVCLRIEQALIR